MPARLENQKGRIAAIFESTAFVVIEFSLGGGQPARALFDRSRVVGKARDVRPMVRVGVLLGLLLNLLLLYTFLLNLLLLYTGYTPGTS